MFEQKVASEIRYSSDKEAEIEINETTSGVITVVPHVPESYNPDLVEKVLKRMVDVAVEELDLGKPVLWYYTPMALDVTVPANATAEVRVPAESRWAVTEGGTIARRLQPLENELGIPEEAIPTGLAAYAPVAGFLDADLPFAVAD